jgi:hypothetical protein
MDRTPGSSFVARDVEAGCPLTSLNGDARDILLRIYVFVLLIVGNEHAKSFLPHETLKLGPFLVDLVDILLAELSCVMNDSLEKVSTSVEFSFIATAVLHFHFLL